MPAKSKRPFDPKIFLTTPGDGRWVIRYRKDQVVYAQGAVADSVFFIQKGKVKLTVVSQQGNAAVVGVLGSVEFCGEGCLAAQPCRMTTAIAMTECEITRVEKAVFISILRKEPAFVDLFLSHLLARATRVEEDFVDQLFNSSEKRLARALLHLANFDKEGKSEPILTKVTQEMLADMIGTTRSRVSVFMNKFRRLGLIDYNGHLEVYPSLLSVVLHEHPHVADDTTED
jgi:CRP/FNR family cyclic AMP-dependent transcriptional regulator